MVEFSARKVGLSLRRPIFLESWLKGLMWDLSTFDTLVVVWELHLVKHENI